MTLLGKAFTVVIFLLSLTFMVLALAVNASHRNWRDLVLGDEGYAARIAAITIENEQLQDAKQRAQASLDREQAARRTALAALQTQLDQLKDELSVSVNTVQKLEAKNTHRAVGRQNRLKRREQRHAVVPAKSSRQPISNRGCQNISVRVPKNGPLKIKK